MALRCCRGAADAARCGVAVLLMLRVAALLVLLQRCCCNGAVAEILFIFIFFNDSWQVQESLTSLHVHARNIEQERTREL
jgi:hypothetical protein